MVTLTVWSARASNASSEAAASTEIVTGVDDQFDDGDQVTTITVSVDAANSDDAFDLLPAQTVSATTIDDDGAGFTVVESGGSTTVNETGTTDDFTVVLDAQPTSDVVIDVTSADTGEAIEGALNAARTEPVQQDPERDLAGRESKEICCRE